MSGDRSARPAADSLVGLPSYHAQVTTARCITLTTYAADGSPVATPVFFTRQDDVLLVQTSSASEKIERITANDSARISTCDLRGAQTSCEVPARVRILGSPDAPGSPAPTLWLRAVQRCMTTYRAVKRLILRRPAEESVLLAVVPFEP